MKRNKSLVILGAAAIMVVVAFGQVAAQTATLAFKKGAPESTATARQDDKGDRGAKRLEMLQERLNLTAEQMTKIRSILTNSRERMKKSLELAGDDKEAFKKAKMDAMKNIDARIQEVLTPDQRMKYTEVKAEMKAKMKDDDDKKND